MRKIFILLAVGLVLAAAGGSVWLLQAARPSGRPLSTGAATSSALFFQATTPPTVAAPTVAPNLITVNTPTQVLITVNIPEPTVTGVNLLRINANGTSTIIASMLDDGKNGDQVAGDKTFTARSTFIEAQAGEVKLQVSAAFRGLLKRGASSVVSISVEAIFLSPLGDYTINLPPSFGANVDSFPSSLPNPPVSVDFAGTRPDSGDLEQYYIRVIQISNSIAINQWLSDNDADLFSPDRTYSPFSMAGNPSVLVASETDGRLSAFTMVGNKVYQISWPNYQATDGIGMGLFVSFLSSWRPR